MRQPIPAGFMASLVHHDTPASPTSVEQPSGVEPADQPAGGQAEQPAVVAVEVAREPDVQLPVQPEVEPDVEPDVGPDLGSDVEPDVEPARPARRRRRASAPSGPPIVKD